jgi:hypothetical protein
MAYNLFVLRLDQLCNKYPVLYFQTPTIAIFLFLHLEIDPCMKKQFCFLIVEEAL